MAFTTLVDQQLSASIPVTQNLAEENSHLKNSKLHRPFVGPVTKSPAHIAQAGPSNVDSLENVPEDQPDYFDGTTLQEERKI